MTIHFHGGTSIVPTDTPRLTRIRTGLITWVIIAAGLLLSLWLHFNISGSEFTISADSWHRTIQIHRHNLPFSARPFQSNATVLVHHLTGLSDQVSFFVVEYLLAGLTAFLFFRLLLQLGFRRTWANIGVALFLLSFPVLAAHFAPVNTWDDFWMYAALVGLSMAVLRHQWPLAAVLFAIACLTRETAILFFPVLAFMAWHDRKRTHPAILLACLLAPLLAYGWYSATFEGRYSADTWRMLAHNFGTRQRTADSVVSLINAFGWLLPAAGLGGWLIWKRRRTAAEVFLLFGALMYWPLNTVVSSAFAMVRETRLLFPPFVFLIPLALSALNDVWQSGLKRAGWQRWGWYVLSGVGLCAAGIGLASIWWPELDYKTSSELRRNFAGVNIGLAAGFILLWLHKRILDRGHKRHRGV